MVSHWSLLLVDAIGKISNPFGHQFNLSYDHLFGHRSTDWMETNAHVLLGFVGNCIDVGEFGHTFIVALEYGGKCGTELD